MTSCARAPPSCRRRTSMPVMIGACARPARGRHVADANTQVSGPSPARAPDNDQQLGEADQEVAFGLTNWTHWRIRVLLCPGKPDWSKLATITPSPT